MAKTFKEEFKNKFAKFASKSFDDGCPTCGYNASSAMSDDDYALMIEEMDKWIKETFKYG